MGSKEIGSVYKNTIRNDGAILLTKAAEVALSLGTVVLAPEVVLQFDIQA